MTFARTARKSGSLHVSSARRARAGAWLFAFATAVAACGSKPEPAAPKPDVEAAPPPAPETPLPPNTIRRSAVQRAVDAGLGRLLQRVELDDQPVLVKGKFQGFRIVALRGDPADWAGVDLQPGDVVRRLNGQSVEHPKEAFEAFQSLESARKVTLEYERAGAVRTIEYAIFDDVPPRAVDPKAAKKDAADGASPAEETSGVVDVKAGPDPRPAPKKKPAKR